MPICHICKRKYRVITNTHLLLHGVSVSDYAKKYGGSGVGFALTVKDLKKTDPRYLRWRKSLKRRENLDWSKGHTKHSHPSVAKISETFKRNRIDNFSTWRTRVRLEGIIPRIYPSLKKGSDLAFLIGLVLGDGNIYRFERTEGLRITLGTDKPALLNYAKKIMWSVFRKEPRVAKVKGANCATVTLYQNKISERMGIPNGDRSKKKIQIPRWVLKKRSYVIRYLRGLYEAEGSHCIHKPTGTYELFFSNKNRSLLNNVTFLLKKLGFNPHESKGHFAVQLSRREEVFRAIELLQFRKY